MCGCCSEWAHRGTAGVERTEANSMTDQSENGRMEQPSDVVIDPMMGSGTRQDGRVDRASLHRH